MVFMKNILNAASTAALVISLGASTSVSAKELSGSDFSSLDCEIEEEYIKTDSFFRKEDIIGGLSSSPGEIVHVLECVEGESKTAGERFIRKVANVHELPFGNYQFKICKDLATIPKKLDIKDMDYSCDTPLLLIGVRVGEKNVTFHDSKDEHKYNSNGANITDGVATKYLLETDFISALAPTTKTQASTFTASRSLAGGQLVGGEDNIFIPLNSTDSQISKFNIKDAVKDGYTDISKSYEVRGNKDGGNLEFGYKTEREVDSILKDVYLAGHIRDGTQSGLIVSYQMALAKNGNDGSNIGVSGLELLIDDVIGLVGQEACDTDGECHTITLDSLFNSLRVHATAESIAEHYNATQNLNNGYLTDVSKIIELNEKADFLTKQPLARLVLPINQIIQGGRDNYQHHHVIDAVSDVAKINMVEESTHFNGNGLTSFENVVNTNVKTYFGGNN